MKLLVILILAAASSAPAHELLVDVEIHEPAVIARASYGSNDPASECDVVVQRPGALDEAFQKGRTDANGVFSFVPDAAGDWRLTFDDGMGHLLVKVVNTDGQAAKESGVSLPFDWQKTLTGVSLIFGVAGVLLWLKTKSGSGVASGR